MRDIMQINVCGGGTYTCLQFSVQLCVRLLCSRVSLEECTGFYTMHVYGIFGTVTIWRYGQFIVFCTSVSTVCVCHKGTITDTPRSWVCFIHL